MDSTHVVRQLFGFNLIHLNGMPVSNACVSKYICTTATVVECYMLAIQPECQSIKVKTKRMLVLQNKLEKPA